MALSLNDPRLTAFALGELTGRDAEEVKRYIAAHPEAAQLVRDIQRVSGALTRELTREPLPPHDSDLRHELEKRFDGESRTKKSSHGLQSAVTGTLGTIARLLPGGKLAWKALAAAGALAAIVALVMVVTGHQEPQSESRHTRGRDAATGALSSNHTGGSEETDSGEAISEGSSAKTTGTRDLTGRANVARAFGGHAYNAAENPVSEFPLTAAHASYDDARRALEQGRLPKPTAVRIEEFVNAFKYRYDEPVGDSPFSINVEITEAPWDKSHRLVRIGVRGKSLAPGSGDSGSDLVVAKDAKVVVQFNRDFVSSYRLLGFSGGSGENSAAVKGADVKSDSQVTALYDVVPAGTGERRGELLGVRVHFTDPKSSAAKKIEVTVQNEVKPLARASDDTKFAAAAAGFAMILQHTDLKGDAAYSVVLDLADQSTDHGTQDEDHRRFLNLVRTARRLDRSSSDQR